MLIQIRQETTYRYAVSANYSMQVLRSQPQDSGTQKVLSWRLSVHPHSTITEGRDAYGNILQTLYIDRPHGDITLTIEGEVETRDAGGVVSGTSEPFPPEFFLRQTELTAPDEAIRLLAAETKARSDGSPLDFAHRLMGAVRDAVDYRIGETHAATTAAEALSHTYGVCQDHTHVFLAAARAEGLPARYVSGYLWDDVDTEYEASHAWAEAYIDGLGWVGFDVANRLCPTDAHVRVACGLDYLEAAPVRGLRRGGGEETMEVRLRVDAGAAQQQ